MFQHIGNFIVKQRYWIIAAWVVLAAFMVFLAPSLKDVGQLDTATFLPQDTEASKASELMSRYFPTAASDSSASLVFYSADGLSGTDLDYAEEVRNWIKSQSETLGIANTTSIFDNAALKSTLISPDNTTMLLSVGLTGEVSNTDVINSLREHLQSTPSGLNVYVSGQAGILADLQQAVLDSLDLTTIITVILVIILLLIIYRSPVAALVPLLTIGAAYLVSRGALGFIAQAGVSVWSQLDAFLIVLIFGVGTDYCMFMISRFHEETKLQDNRLGAMRKTVGKIGIVITASAFTVIIGLSGMAIARYGMLKTMGPLLALSVFITLLAALTLAPSLAAAAGKYLYWPNRESAKSTPKENSQSRESLFQKIARLSTGKPGRVFIVAIIIVLLPCLAYPQLNRSFDQIQEIPDSFDSVQGYQVLQEHYDIGEMEPVQIVIVAPDDIDLIAPQSLSALSKIANDLKNLDGVLNVKSIVNPQGSAEDSPSMTVSGQLTALSTALDISEADLEFLVSPDTEALFQKVQAYLIEIGASFTWVKTDSSYQAVIADMGNLQSSMSQIKSNTSVTNQVKLLAEKLTENSESESLLTPNQIANYLELLQAYLNELREAYPGAAAGSAYQAVLKDCSSGLTSITRISTLSAEQQTAAAVQLKEGLQKLGQDLSLLTVEVESQELYLPSRVLAKASGSDPSVIITAIQHQADAFKTDLTSLAAQFKKQDNPFFISETLMQSSDILQSVKKMFVSQDQKASLLMVVLDSYPASDKAIQTIDSVREALNSSARGTVLERSTMVVGGNSAVMTDIKHMIDSDFNKIMIIVMITTFLVLVFLLRSLIAPLYLLLAVLLSYGATLGILTLVFQNWAGNDGINFLIPVVTFVLLVALGSDYNIFLMSRIREESDARGIHEGARVAVAATGAVILACGIILAGTFSALASSSIRFMLQIGVAVAIGVLIDTVIMQLFLLPAVAAKLGKWNWWPFKRK